MPESNVQAGSRGSHHVPNPTNLERSRHVASLSRPTFFSGGGESADISVGNDSRQVSRSVPPDDEIWGLESTPAPNGFTWTIYYVGHDGDVPDPGSAGGLSFDSSTNISACPPLTRWQRFVAYTVRDSRVHYMCASPLFPLGWISAQPLDAPRPCPSSPEFPPPVRIFSHEPETLLP